MIAKAREFLSHGLTVRTHQLARAAHDTAIDGGETLPRDVDQRRNSRSGGALCGAGSD